MIYFKSCLKCQGDVHLNTDAYGSFMKCLQCGQVWDFRKPHENTELQEELAELAAMPESPEPELAPEPVVAFEQEEIAEPEIELPRAV